MKLNKKQRAELKQKYDGHCAYCGEVLGDRWNADHFNPIRRNWRYVKGVKQYTDSEHPEHDHIDNYMPSCISCNLDKNSLDIEDWRQMIANKVTCLNRDNATYQKAKRYGLIIETGADVVFYFEKVESSLPKS